MFGRSLSSVRAPRLILAGLLAFAIFGGSGSGLSGREASEGAAAASSGSFPGDVSAVFEEAGALVVRGNLAAHRPQI